MSFTQEQEQVLRAIADAILRATGQRVSVGTATVRQPVTSGEAASEDDCKSKYGNPTVFRDPPKWQGQSYKGKFFSQCPVEYLNSLAGFLDWQAQKDSELADPPKHKNGTPYYEYRRKDARLARGWARLNDGVAIEKEPEPEPEPAGQAELGFGDSEDDIPF